MKLDFTRNSFRGLMMKLDFTRNSFSTPLEELEPGDIYRVACSGDVAIYLGKFTKDGVAEKHWGFHVETGDVLWGNNLVQKLEGTLTID